MRVAGGRNLADDPEATAMLSAAVAGIADGPDWGEAHLAAWAEAYRAFGARPNRTPCSAEALRKRALKQGALPAINAVVDVYNALSLRYAIPVGGEDLRAYSGSPPADRPPTAARASRPRRNGEPAVETVDAGEVVWRDDLGVTCRRWNWRQGPRTRLTEASTDMWFVFEAARPDAAVGRRGGRRRVGRLPPAAGARAGQRRDGSAVADGDRPSLRGFRLGRGPGRRARPE